MEEETTLTTETFSNQRAGRAASTEGPGQPPGLGTGRRAARADRGAVRGHARPARPPDRPQLPDRPRPARPLVRRRLDTAAPGSPSNLPPFVWLTSRGSKVARSRFRTWEANPGLATHIEAVTNVRLLLERELRLGAWECERALAQSIALPLRDQGPPPRRRARHAADGSRSRSSSPSRAAPASTRSSATSARPTRRSGTSPRRGSSPRSTRLANGRPLRERHRPPLPAARRRASQQRRPSLTLPGSTRRGADARACAPRAVRQAAPGGFPRFARDGRLTAERQRTLTRARARPLERRHVPTHSTPISDSKPTLVDRARETADGGPDGRYASSRPPTRPTQPSCERGRSRAIVRLLRQAVELRRAA